MSLQQMYTFSLKLKKVQNPIFQISEKHDQTSINLANVFDFIG